MNSFLGCSFKKPVMYMMQCNTVVSSSLQDWFNKRLKQLVFDLGNQEGASSTIKLATDGGGMSLARGVADDGPMTGYPVDDPEVRDVDLMQ